METRKGSTARVAACAERIFTLPEICVERERYYTRSYQQTEGELPVLRQAKAFAETLDHMSVRIDEGELIVGCPCSKARGGAVLPELNAQWLRREVDDMSVRQWDRFQPPSEQEKEELLSLLTYWEGKSAYDRWEKRVPEPILKMHESGFIGGVTFSNNGFYPCHVAVDYEMVLRGGMKARYEEALKRREELDLFQIENLEKYHLYTAMTIALDAVRRFSLRYAHLAENMAAGEADPARAAELREIARVCAKVPWEPAETFHEAVQAAYMTWVVLMIEGWGHGMTLGRPDQYLIDYYRADLEAGRLTREQARELLELWFVKVNGTVTLDDHNTATCFAGFPQAVNFTLGGVDRQGNCAVNELTYLLMEAEESIGMTAEDLVIRIGEESPREYLLAAARLAKVLKGKLKFVSDPVAIEQLLADGYPLELARDYIITGCNSPSIPGVSLDVPGGLFNAALMLELALNNGVSRMTGKQVGLPTGDPRKFTSFEQVWEAFCAQTRHFLGAAAVMTNEDRAIFARFLPIPLQSALFHGPMERGLDLFSGGTGQYARQSISIAGAPNVGDGLAALKKVVFEDKKLTMERVIDALDANFEGYDDVRHLLGKAPKFGNGDRFVDELVDQVLVFCSDVLHSYEGECGTPLITAAATITANVPLGYGVGALPGGRLAGTPIAEGGISPQQGRNKSGPTATMRSVAGLTHTKLTNGSVLNMRFDPDVLKNEAGMEKFTDLLRAYLLNGGFFVQFNIIDTETLRQAQQDPERYRDLLVRVATYSAYFVELSPEMQEDIINRMEFKSL
ncbi:MAG: glycyl radical protein [Oscillospiraceae bacterium]